MFSKSEMKGFLILTQLHIKSGCSSREKAQRRHLLLLSIFHNLESDPRSFKSETQSAPSLRNQAQGDQSMKAGKKFTSLTIKKTLLLG